MSVETVVPPGAAGAGTDVSETVRRRMGRIAGGTALYTYLLIVFGGIVRITGSGLGCGDDWPLCNGHWIPPMTFETVIEYVHRLLAAALIVPFGALAFYAVRHRNSPGFAGPGGLNRPVALAYILLVVQVLLGATTVKLELPAGVTALHFVTAVSILATLLVAMARAGRRVAAGGATGTEKKFAAAAVGAAALGICVIAFGALTANTGLPPAAGQPSGAAWACQGFPLCNGKWLPSGGSWVHIHWTHRLLAFLLLFHVLAATVTTWKRGAPAAIRRASLMSLALVVIQIAGAAALVLMRLPDWLQAFHLAVGTGVWASLAYWASVARQFERMA